MKTPDTESKRGWGIRVNGITLDRLKEIQDRSKVGKPSYTSIIDTAVNNLWKETRPGK